MMNLRKNAITIKRALLIFAIIIFVAACIAGCGAGADTSDKTEGAAESRFRSQMADAGTTEIAVKKNLVLEAPVEVNGTKVLYGEGSITAVGDAWAGDDYMIVVQPGAQLTVKGSVSINAGGITGGVRAAQEAAWSIEETASVKNASARAANTRVEGAFHMNGGTMSGAMGHNVYNVGAVTVSEGEIIGSGTKCAGIYSEGVLTQNGGTIRDAYNNVVVLSGGSFQFNGGSNQDSIHDGIYVAEAAELSVTAKSAAITGSGVRGIYLCGEATVDGITLNSSGDSLVKISKTGTLNLNGGMLTDAGYHSVENAGKMVMTGGSVRNSYNCGIVNSGTLEITGGSILDNVNNKGVLNKHDGKATISGQAVMFSGNRFAIANEDTATLELSKAEILLTTTTNVYAFDGEVNIHDMSLGASGSNNVRIYKAEVTMNNVQVLGNSGSGSSTTHGILLEGGALKATDVTIKNTTGYGIRNKGGHITAENMVISKSLKAGGINNTVQDYTGLPGVADIKNLTIEQIRYNNIVVDGGTLTVTDGHLAASGTNNVKTTGGVLNLNNVDVLGNLPDMDGTNHAVYMTGGKIQATDVNISDAKVSCLRINGETAVFSGNKVSIRNATKYGIDQTVGEININNLTMAGNYYNISNQKGIIKLKNSTLGPTMSNNLRTHGGLIDLRNVAVNGHTKNHVKSVHALFVSGGTMTGQNVTVKDVSNAGLRVGDGTVNIRGLTVNDAGADGVWISKGKATLSDLVIKKAGAAGVAATGTSSITVIGGSIANTVSHGAKSENDAKVTLKDVSVAMPATGGRHAVLAQGGDVHLENVGISGNAENTTGAGIRINKDTSHVTGNGIKIAEVNIGISANAGTSDIHGVTTENVIGHSVQATASAKLVISDSLFGVTGTNNAKAESKGTITLNHVVIEGTTKNHGIMVENDGNIYGKDITVRNTAGNAVRVKCSSGGSHIEIDGLVTENVGTQNIWISKDADDGNVGSVVIKNGDLCRTGTHNVRVEAGNLTLIDTKIQGHTSGVANDIHAIYVSDKTENINLDGVTVLDAAGDALRIASGNVVAENFTSNQTGRNGVWANGGSLTAKNLTVSGSKNVGVYITGGTAVVNGANISGSANNVSVTGVELTINGYADGSKSQIGTSSKDNVVANDGGVVRLNNATVLESKANNIVTTKGKVFLTDVDVTGGNYSVLVQDAGYAELDNVTIKDSVKDGIRVNRADGVVVTNNVQINNPIRYGISAEKGTVELKGELSVSSNAKKSRAIYACIGGKVTTADNAEVTISGTEYGIFADSNAVIDMDNVAISGCTKSSFEMTGGTAVLNGVNISGSSANNILVSGGELTVNGYAENSKSQVGTAKEDNIKATGEGVIRLNDVNVLKSSKNNVVAISGGTVHMKDSAVTGGNHSVLADNTGTVYLNNVAIKDSANSGIRANHEKSYVEATGVTIDGAKTGLSIKCGTVQITDLTIRNTKDVGVSVAQSTSDANVTLNNLVTENCGTHAVYTSGAAAMLTVNGGTLSNDGSDHVVNLNGGPMTLNDVAINANLASGKYELYSGAGWLTIGGAMDADIYIDRDDGRYIKVNKELTGNKLVVDWKKASTDKAIEFVDVDVTNASRDNIRLGAIQTAADGHLYYYSANGKGYAKLVNKVVTNETQLSEYLAYAASQNMTEVEILIGGSFNVANQVTIPAGITVLTILDDGDGATGNAVTYSGTKDGLFVMRDGLKLTLKAISLNSTKNVLLTQAGGELVVDNCVLDGATKNIVQSKGKLTIQDSTLKTTTSNNVTITEDLILEGDVLVEGPTTAENVHGLYITNGNVAINGNVTVTGTRGAAIQCVGGSNVTLKETGTVTINGGGRAGLLVSNQATMTVKGNLNVANTTGPAIYIGYWGGDNIGTLIVADGGKVTVGKDADGKGIANVGIRIDGKGILDVRAAGALTVSDTAGNEIDYKTGTLKLAGNVNASVVSKNLPVEVTGELTGNLVVDWTTAPSGNAMTFASEAVMNASGDNITLGKTQTDAGALLHYTMDGTKAVAVLVGNRVSSEAGLNAYLNVAAAKGMTDVTVLITGSFDVANQVAIPESITGLTVLDDGDAATGNTVTYTGAADGLFAMRGGLKVTLKDISLKSTQADLLNQTAGEVVVDNCVLNSAEHCVEMNGGTAVLNGVNLTAVTGNIYVGGGELTVNGYADGSKSQISGSTKDNVTATGTGVIRLNDVNVLKSSKNNVVAISGGTVHMKDSAVTGGNHSVLADNTGTVYLNNVAIKDSANSGIRANHEKSYVEATGVTIDGAKTGLSIKCGTVQITDLTIRNTKDVGVSVAQSTSDANVTLNNLVTENCGTHAVYTSGAAAMLTVNGGTLGNDGSDHVVNLNGGPMTLHDVTIHGANLASGKYELYSGAGWLTIGGAMDANVYIATNPGRVIKVNKELTGNNLVVDWKNAPTGNALEFTSEAMMNASEDNIELGSLQGASNMLKYEGKAATLAPCTAVTNWSDLSAKVSAMASGSKTTYRITGNASNWMANAPLAIPAGAQVTLFADQKSPAIVAASGVSPFTLGANTQLTLENVVVGGTASAKAAHIIVPQTATLTLKNATLQHFSGEKGGAVHVNNGTLIATGSTFANNSNTTNWGGAIGIWGGTVNISDSAFTGNTSKNSGGAILNYKADGGSLGGSKDNAVGTLTLTNCTFTSNSTSEHGGAVASWAGGTTTITGCTFDGNSTTKNGGAVHVTDSHTATIENCEFTSNSASSDGGAIYHKSSVQMTVTSCTFTGNKGTEGGAISTTANLKVSGTKFTSNQSTTGRAGAVIVWNAPTVEFNDCVFSGNTAKTNGGAVAKGGNSGGVLKIIDCDFDENSAPNGEGGALMLQSSPTVTITGSTFTGNSAKTNGGVIKNNSSTTALKIENSEFSKNTAGGSGGVLYQQDSNPANLSNCTFAENKAASGNAVLSVGGTVNLTGCDIQEADCSGKYKIVKE